MSTHALELLFIGLLVLGLIALLVHDRPSADRSRSLGQEAREVLRMTVSRPLRGAAILSHGFTRSRRWT